MSISVLSRLSILHEGKIGYSCLSNVGHQALGVVQANVTNVTNHTFHQMSELMTLACHFDNCFNQIFQLCQSNSSKCQLFTRHKRTHVRICTNLGFKWMCEMVVCMYMKLSSAPECIRLQTTWYIGPQYSGNSESWINIKLRND